MTPAKGKIVLITGASKGAGRGIALKLAAAGYTLVFNYYSNDADVGNAVALSAFR
jgi:NAD(P)-dependent dehydrogenase (short-subunit alcohol dehydrogenase family)